MLRLYPAGSTWTKHNMAWGHRGDTKFRSVYSYLAPEQQKFKEENPKKQLLVTTCNTYTTKMFVCMTKVLSDVNMQMHLFSTVEAEAFSPLQQLHV